MPLTIDKRTDDQLDWDGGERRIIEERRAQTERRKDIRFELNSNNRRHSDGRRKEDEKPWHKPHD